MKIEQEFLWLWASWHGRASAVFLEVSLMSVSASLNLLVISSSVNYETFKARCGFIASKRSFSQTGELLTYSDSCFIRRRITDLWTVDAVSYRISSSLLMPMSQTFFKIISFSPTIMFSVFYWG